MELVVDFSVFEDGSVALSVAGSPIDDGGVEADMELADELDLFADDLRVALEESELTPAGRWHLLGEVEIDDDEISGRFSVVNG